MKLTKHEIESRRKRFEDDRRRQLGNSNYAVSTSDFMLMNNYSAVDVYSGYSSSSSSSDNSCSSSSYDNSSSSYDSYSSSDSSSSCSSD